MSESASPSKPRGASLSQMPRWKKLLLATAGLCLIVGAGLKGWSMVSKKDASETRSTTANSEGRSGTLSAGQGGLIDTRRDGSGDDGGTGTGGTGAESDAPEDWSPFFFKGGFGFFVGFCVGHFLRAFLKVSAVGIGLLALVLLGLQYAGVVDVNWDSLSGYYDKLSALVQRESKEFFTFVNGTIPSAAAATVGLFTGFKKK